MRQGAPVSDTDPILAAAERFAAVHVVVVGSMNVDQITYCRRVPDEGETLVADRYEQGFGGKGANQAVMAARLGARVSFVGCVGDDALGAETVANLTANGVDTAGIRVVAETATGVAPIWVDQHGANRILIAPGANNALDATHVRSALDALDRPPDVVVAQLETPQSATAAAFAWAAEHEIVTVLNPAPAATIPPDVLEHTTWLVPNEPEFELLFGSPATADSVAAAGRRGLVVTCGADGVLVVDGSSARRIAAPIVDVVDTTGAGDAFVGAFCVALSAELAPLDAARLAVAAATRSVTARGTQRSFPILAAVIAALDHPMS